MSTFEDKVSGRRLHGFNPRDKAAAEVARLSAKYTPKPSVPQEIASAIRNYATKEGPSGIPGFPHRPINKIGSILKEDAGKVKDKAVMTGAAAVVAGTVLFPNQAAAEPKKPAISIEQVINDRMMVQKETKQEVNPLFKRLTSEEFEQYKNSKRESISGNYKLNENDINHLTWNLFHEARGENSQGLLGVMLTVLERAKSGKFPGSIPGIIYQSKQFSWTFQNKNVFPLPEMETSDQESKMSKKDQKLLFAIHEFVKNYSKGKSIDTLIDGAKKELGISKDQKILFYKKNSKAWDENVEGNNLSEGSRKLFKKLKNVKRILNHDFYTE